MPSHHARNMILADTAKRIIAAAEARGVRLRILGGLGIYLKCPDFREVLDHCRDPLSDIDLIGLSGDSGRIEEALGSLGYKQNVNWKMLFGYQRRIFYTPEDITIEIYLDRLYLCQEMDLRSRLGLDSPTLSPTDLLLSRIQRVELAPKDRLDLCVLLTAKDLGADSPETIDLGYVSALAAGSWPWWKTIRDNLDLLLSVPPPAMDPEPLHSRLLRMKQAVDREPKSLSWKMRALAGTRVQWYADVE